jgi:hypothetical protein
MGYQRMMVFDNYGNYLLSTGSIDTFTDLNAYLLSNAEHGTAVHYLDVCAVGERYGALATAVVKKVRADVLQLAGLRNEEGRGS